MTAPRFDWQHEGRLVGESLDGLHAILVLGDDATATALVALGIGRTQGRRRRVAVADLLGDAPPIQELVSGDDAHGITDSFSFGVSLNRIAHPVPGSGELFVMPSGSEPLEHAEILPNERWRRLASGFREVGALLVLAAPASAVGVEVLAQATDGVVLVGEVVPAALPVALVLATVRAPAPAPVFAAPPAAKGPPPRRSFRRAQAAAGIVIAALLGLAGVWLAQRPMASTRRPVAPPDRGGLVAASLASATDTESAGGIAPQDDAALPVVENPADSTLAAAWVVELVKENTPAGASASLARLRDQLPAATVGPVIVNDGAWYRVVGGANRERAGADSLLRALRESGALTATTGMVERLPLAFLVRERVGAQAVDGPLRDLHRRGLPAYALQQDDGTVNIYVGAFESPDQAGLAAPALRQAGLSPRLAHRLGRTF